MRPPLSDSEGFPAAVVRHFFAGTMRPGQYFEGWVPVEMTHESSDGWVVIFQSERNANRGARVTFRGSFDDLPEKLPFDLVYRHQRMVPVPNEYVWE